MEIAGASADAIARAVTSGEITHSEVIERTFARIEERNAAVNAFAWLRTAEALDDARRAEKEGARRPLEGVPFTVKELAAIADGPSELGSRAFEGHRSGVDAEFVARLKRAGAIPVGMTTASEFGARPTTESALHGVTRNPWNLERTSGGSSGGAAVSAALGFAPLNQGSDAGGSVRTPSSCCGVFGLKTTRGRISFGPLLSEEWGGVDTIGPITRTVRDAALFLDVAAGPAAGDPYWAPPPERSFVAATEEEPHLRVAVAFENDEQPIDDDVRAAVRATADLLSDLGHEVEHAQPDLSALRDEWILLTTVGIASVEGIDDKLDLLEPRTRLIVDIGMAARAVDFVRAQKRMHRAARAVAPFFERYDILLAPTLARTALPVHAGGDDIVDTWRAYWRNWLSWVWPFNATGQPAASVPAGLSGEGLPIGVQLVAGVARERTILSVAAQLERARPWADLHPPLW